MRNPRDAYQRDYDSSVSGMNRQSRADVTGEEEPSGIFTVMIDGRAWKTGSSNEMFGIAERVANKYPDKKIVVQWPTGQMNTIKPQGMAEGSQQVDSLVTDALKIMRGAELNDAVQALKTVLGDREYNDRRSHYRFYVRQLMDMYGQQGVAEGQRWPDSSNSLAKRSAVVTDLKGAPSKAGRGSGMTVATRVEPTITPTSVNRLGGDRPIPSFLQKDVAEAEVDSDGHSVDHADSGEYDYEGDQARDQMNTIVRAAQRLNGMLDDDENMPEWVQMKVTLAADYLDTAADYIESNQEPELAEGGQGSGRPTPGEWDTTSGKVGRVEKTATGIRHHADPSRYGGTEPDAEDDHLLSSAQRHRLAKAVRPEVDEGSKQPEQPEADYGDDYQDMVKRLKQLAGAGPLKTVYDPDKRVYRNIPTAVQPKR